LEINEDEYIIYRANPINQFNEFTAIAKQLQKETVSLYISTTLKEKLALEEGDKVAVTANSATVTLDVKIDNDLVGDISYVPTFDKNVDTKSLFKNRLEVAKLRKV